MSPPVEGVGDEMPLVRPHHRPASLRGNLCRSPPCRGWNRLFQHIAAVTLQQVEIDPMLFAHTLCNVWQLPQRFILQRVEQAQHVAGRRTLLLADLLWHVLEVAHRQ